MKNPEKKILIVENNLKDRMVTNSQSGYSCFPFSVIIASSLKEARIKLKENTFQGVVSDYYLEDGIGPELIPDLGGSSLIILTAEGSEEMALMALNAGADDFLIKDKNNGYIKLLPYAVNKSIEQKTQRNELNRYRTQLENIVEERTNDLIDMYSKLQDSETNFKNIFNNTSDGFVITDYDFNFLEANNTLLNRFGYKKEFLAAQSLIDFLVPAYHDIIYKRHELVKKGLPTGDIEIEVKPANEQQVISFEINNVPIIFNHKNAILTVIRDITERKSIARKLFDAIIQTEEEERARIARDLHDEIGPLISALKIYITSFIESSSMEKKDKLARQMGIIIRDVIESIKNISNDMSPHVLVNFGLTAAIQNIIDLFSKNLKIHLSTNLTGLRFPSTVEAVLYRIIKELVNNTVKHAKAANVFINLDYADFALVCNYLDDGIGFNWEQKVNSQAKGMGISNIISRIHSLGGDFEVQSNTEHGFEINFVFKTSPIDANSKQEI